jgi:hypothetical protein
VMNHETSCTLPYASLMTWQALVKEAGLQPDNAALTVAMVVDGTSSTGSFIKSDIIVRSTGSFL